MTSWLKRLQTLPRAKKIQFIWATIIIAVFLLALLWIFTSRIGKFAPADTTLFKTMINGIKDIKNEYEKGE